MDKTQTIPFESAQEFLVMRNLYESAVKQLALKFEILNSEFNIQYSRNPIHHIESRVKSAQSILAKLTKKGMPDVYKRQFSHRTIMPQALKSWQQC